MYQKIKTKLCTFKNVWFFKITKFLNLKLQSAKYLKNVLQNSTGFKIIYITQENIELLKHRITSNDISYLFHYAIKFFQGINMLQK